MNKRVHEIAKERGLPAKEVLDAPAGGGRRRSRRPPRRSTRRTPAACSDGGDGQAPDAPAPAGGAAPAPRGQRPAVANERPQRGPTRLELGRAGRHAPTLPRVDAPQPAARRRAAESDELADGHGGRDGRAARRSRDRPQAPDARLAPGRARARHARRPAARGDRLPGFAPRARRRGGPPSQPAAAAPAPRSAPARRLRRGGRVASLAAPRVAEPDAIQINSGSTVKDVAEYLDVPVPEMMKKLMALGEMKTLTQTLSDDVDPGARGRARQGSRDRPLRGRDDRRAGVRRRRGGPRRARLRW